MVSAFTLKTFSINIFKHKLYQIYQIWENFIIVYIILGVPGTTLENEKPKYNYTLGNIIESLKYF